jgi:hypothetical protein
MKTEESANQPDNKTPPENPQSDPEKLPAGLTGLQAWSSL